MTEPRKPITIRVTTAEHDEMKAAAGNLSLTLSAWLRMIAIAEARRVKRDLKKGEPK